jgi:hypothetical protein
MATLNKIQLPYAGLVADGQVRKEDYRKIYESAPLALLYEVKAALESQITSAMSGAPVTVAANDFGTGDGSVLQQMLTDHAEAELGASPLPNNVRVINLYDNRQWIYNADTGTWADAGPITAAGFSNTALGLIRGSDAPLHVSAKPDGTGKVNGAALQADLLTERLERIVGDVQTLAAAKAYANGLALGIVDIDGGIF